jgi:hypothetical protein
MQFPTLISALAGTLSLATLISAQFDAAYDISECDYSNLVTYPGYLSGPVCVAWSYPNFFNGGESVTTQTPTGSVVCMGTIPPLFEIVVSFLLTI